jgi:hypothetical protein
LVIGCGNDDGLTRYEPGVGTAYARTGYGEAWKLSEREEFWYFEVLYLDTDRIGWGAAFCGIA